MDEIGKKNLKMIIPKVTKLGWIRTVNGEPYMHLADVEKTILALFDPHELARVSDWAASQPEMKQLPELQILELERLRKSVKIQADMLGQMMRKESCIFKLCPFPKVPRVEEPG